MKIGCCISMFGIPGEIIGRRYLGILKDCGLDYVELPLAQMMDLSDAQFTALRCEVDACGVPCRSCNNLLPARIKIVGEHTDRKELENYLDTAFSRAQSLGAKAVVFGSSGSKNVPEGFAFDAAYRQIVENGRIIGEYAEKYGLDIAIEPLRRQESNIIRNLAEGEELRRDIASPRVSLLVDYYHLAAENGSAAELDIYADDIVHTHFAEPEKRRIPAALSDDMKGFIRRVNAMKHSPRMSIEAYSDDPAPELKAAVRLIRQALAE